MKTFDKYLHKEVKIICTDDTEIRGTVDSFGGSVQGLEEYNREENFLSIYTGDEDIVFFESEIKEIVEM